MFRDLFFDFDGTLADSSEGIYESFKVSCFKLNLEPIPINEFKKFIKPSELACYVRNANAELIETREIE